MSAQPIPSQYSFLILDGSDQSAATENQVKHFNVGIKTTKNLTEFREHMEKVPADEHGIIMITSGSLGIQLKDEFVEDKYPQIHAIYVYCQSKGTHQRWASTIPKIKGVFTAPSELTEEIKNNHFSTSQPKKSEPTPTLTPTPAPAPAPAPAPVSAATAKVVRFPIEFESDVNIRYYVARILINYLTGLSPNAEAKTSFADFLISCFPDNAGKKALFEEFSVNYTSNQPMQWIWRDSCFSELLSQAIKYTQPVLLSYSGFLLYDLVKQFQQHKCTTPMELYLGQHLSQTHCQQLNNLRGQHIMFPTFLRTTNDRNSAVIMANTQGSSDASKPVLFTIKADPNSEDMPLFASAKSLEETQAENEFVIMIGCLCRIDDIKDEADGLTSVQMTLCERNDQSANQLYDYYKQSHLQQKDRNLVKYWRLVADIGRDINESTFLGLAFEFIEQYVKNTQDEVERMDCNDTLGMIELVRSNVDQSIEWHLKSINAKEKHFPKAHPTLIKSYEDVGQAYQTKGDFQQATIYFQKALDGMKELGPDVEADLYVSYARVASSYENEKKQREALANYLHALACIVKHEGKDHSTYGAIYHNIANLYQYLDMYPLAIGFYQSALEAKEKAFPSAHISVANTYKNLGILYQQIDDIVQAREHLEKAAAIYKALENEQSPSYQDVQELLKGLPKPNEN